jgi:hypothetical protein
LDAETTFTKGPPTKLIVNVRPNAYEPGRAHISIINPAGLAGVDVDLSDVLTPGQEFRIRSVKDIFGPPVTTGIYNGEPVQVSMKPISPPLPLGIPDATQPTTEPYFAAFLVTAVRGE